MNIDIWKLDRRGGDLSTLLGHIHIAVGEAFSLIFADSTVTVPLRADEILPLEELQYELRHDGGAVFLGGQTIAFSYVVDMVQRTVARIPLLRSLGRENWYPGGMTQMVVVHLSDERLIVAYESGIFLLDSRWQLVWHRELPWVHVGFYPYTVDGEVVWAESEWGNIGYELRDGTVLDPAGMWDWRLKQYLDT